MSAALGLGVASLSSTLGRMSSKLGALSRVGDVAGDDPWEVIKVRWPDDMYEKRCEPSLKLSSCRSPCDMTLFAVESSPVDGLMDGS